MNQGKLTIPVDDGWENGDKIDLRHYWNIINRRKWSIIGLALAVALLTTLVVFAMTPIYRASATLLIESQAANLLSMGPSSICPRTTDPTTCTEGPGGSTRESGPALIAPVPTPKCSSCSIRVKMVKRVTPAR